MQDLRHLPHSTEQEWERTAAPQQELWVGYAPHQIVHGHPQQVTVCSQCQCEPQQIFQPDPIQPGHFRVVDAQMSQQYQYCDAVWPISPQRPYHTTAIQVRTSESEINTDILDGHGTCSSYGLDCR